MDQNQQSVQAKSEEANKEGGRGCKANEDGVAAFAEAEMKTLFGKDKCELESEVNEGNTWLFHTLHSVIFYLNFEHRPPRNCVVATNILYNRNVCFHFCLINPLGSEYAPLKVSGSMCQFWWASLYRALYLL